MARDIDRVLLQRMADARILSQADVLEGQNTSVINQYLGEISAESEVLDEINVFDLSGNASASSNWQQRATLSISDYPAEIRNLFESALHAKQGDVFVSNALLLDAGPDIVLSTPVTDDNNDLVINVLLVEVNLSVVGAVVTELENSVTGNKHAYLVDHDGRVIVSGNRSIPYLSRIPELDINPDLLTAVTSREIDEIFTYTDSFGNEFLAGYAALRQLSQTTVLDWSIISIAHTDEVLAPVRALKTKLISFFVLVGIAIALITLFFFRSIIDPIRKLSVFAKGIAQ